MHLYAYLGVGLAIPHQLWTGADFTSSTGRQVFWWTAWALAAWPACWCGASACPLWRNLRHDLRVAAVVPEGDGTVSVHVTGRDLHRLPVEAGQFFTWRFGGRPGRSRGNPYSLSAAPDGRSLRITVQDVGDGSAAPPASRSGPCLGRRTVRPAEPARPQPRQGADDRRRRRHHAAAGAGGGRWRTPPATRCCSTAPRPPRSSSTSSPPSPHRRGLVVWGLPAGGAAAHSWLGDGVDAATDLAALTSWVPDVAERDVYVCGPGPWADLVLRDLRAAGVPEQHIHLETFGW